MSATAATAMTEAKSSRPISGVSMSSSTEEATKSVNGGSKLSARSAYTIPSDKVRLDVLLITGQRKNFDFEPQTSVKQVREHLWEEWPQDWPPRPISSSAIRILHLGHILDDKFILSAKDATAAASSALVNRSMPVGKSTVVHLLLSQAPAKGDGDEESLKKAAAATPDAGCCSCTIC